MQKTSQNEWIVDLDGTAYRLGRRTAYPLEEISSVKGNKWVLTDFDSASPHFMTVEAPARYAEIVAHRRLMERGDADEHSRILTHWKRARGKTATELFFTQVNGDTYRVYEDRAYDDPDHHLLFAVHGLLYACLRAFSANKTILIMFEHDRHVDLLLGRSGQVLASSRTSSYASTLEAKETQVDTVTQELKSIMANLHGQLELILHLGWLSGGKNGSCAATGSSQELAHWSSVAWAEKLAKTLAVPFKPLPLTMLHTSSDEFVISSLAEAMPFLRVADACSPALDRFCYQTQWVMPWVSSMVALMVTGVCLGGFWLQHQTSLLKEETRNLSNTQVMNVELVDPSHLKMVTFVDQLSRLQAAPSLQEILTDITQPFHGRITLDQVMIEYDEQAKISTTLKGRIQADFAQASQEVESFISSLTSRHFRVIKRDFSTDITSLQFTLKLERE